MHSDDRHLIQSNTVIHMVTVCKMKIIQTIKLAAIVIVLSLFCIQMICRLSLTMRIKSHICYANDQFLSNYSLLIYDKQPQFIHNLWFDVAWSVQNPLCVCCDQSGIFQVLWNQSKCFNWFSLKWSANGFEYQVFVSTQSKFVPMLRRMMVTVVSVRIFNITKSFNLFSNWILQMDYNHALKNYWISKFICVKNI